MKIVLTKHVKERRTKGHIPPNRLVIFLKYLLKQHSEFLTKNGFYIFYKGGTRAVIKKEEDKYIFITFYGTTGWIIDNNDFGIFQCKYQSEESLNEKKEKRKNQKQRTEVDLNRTDLVLITKDRKEKLKKTYKLKKLYENNFFNGAYYVFYSENDLLVDILRKNGSFVKTMTKSMFSSITKIELNKS